MDTHRNLVAFAYTEINEDSAMDNALRSLESSSLVSNAYIKGFAAKVLSQASKVYESTQNLVNVHYASQIETIDSMSPEDQAKYGPGILVRSREPCRCHR